MIDDEVYDSPKFRQQLIDAAASLKVGVPWDATSIVTPVIREPAPELEQGLTKLEPGEEWLLEPKMIDGNPCLWSPGIRIGIQPDGWYHKTECFGPVLGLMRVTSVEEAIKIQNSSEFGLTGGIHSLDPAEIASWKDKVEVGNAYINRATTGAIVQRQPFGGWKNSCIGPGSKAGGPNYVSLFCKWTQTDEPKFRQRISQKLGDWIQRSCVNPEQQQRVTAAAESYEYWWRNEFSVTHDPSQIHGETNEFRYRARPWHIARVESVNDSTVEELLMLAAACSVVGVELNVSIDIKCKLDPMLGELASSWRAESIEDFCSRCRGLGPGSVTRAKSPSDKFLSAFLNVENLSISDSVLPNGRVELLKLFREQAISETVHRYGNIL